MTTNDRLKRLEDAVESLQKHVKWLLEQHPYMAVRQLEIELDHHIEMIDAHKRG